MKILIVVTLVLVLFALGSAGLFMLKRDRAAGARDNRMARSLALRVGLSIALIAFLVVSYLAGWIGPGGLRQSQ